MKDMAEMAKAVQDEGRYGDTMLVHMNPAEFEILQKEWGPATTNPETGHPEFWAWVIPAIQAAVSAWGVYEGKESARRARKDAKGNDVTDSPLEELVYERERTPPPEDYFTYGQNGGEHRFFTDAQYVDPNAETLDEATLGATAVSPPGPAVPVDVQAQFMNPDWQDVLQRYGLGRYGNI